MRREKQGLRSTGKQRPFSRKKRLTKSTSKISLLFQQPRLGGCPGSQSSFPLVRQPPLPLKTQPIQFCCVQDDFCSLLFCSHHSTNLVSLSVAAGSGVLVAHPGAPPPRNRSNRGNPGASAPASPGGLGQNGPFGHHSGPPQVRVRGARSAARCRRHEGAGDIPARETRRCGRRRGPRSAEAGVPGT